MQFHVRPFRRLQWQLSLSYTLVAAGALLVVELILIGGGIFLINTNALPNLLVRAFRAQFSANLRPYLDRENPDYRGAGKFLAAYSSEGQNGELINNGKIWTTQDATQNLIVLDREGKMIWSQYRVVSSEVGQPFNPRLVAGLERVLAAAQANDPEPSHLYTREGNRLVMAIPIEGADAQRVLGTVVFQMDMPSFTNPRFMMQLLPTLLASVLIFTVAAGAVGTVFGFFTARRLTRRLARISTAADHWSRGDFSLFIQEPGTRGSEDELGDLARRLNAMAEQLQNLLETRQELATLQERGRIARELHDSVKQQVFATAMQLGAARALLPDEASPAAQRLEEAEKLTKQAQSELTGLIHALRPAALAGKGLVGALRDLSADWSRQAGIAAVFNCPPATPADLSLPVAKEQALFRVAQEALANIARHSQAKTVRMGLYRQNQEVRLSIEDDGQGFDPKAAEGEDASGAGVGLHSMRERVEAVGGRVEIASAKGKGTRVTIIIPE